MATRALLLVLLLSSLPALAVDDDRGDTPAPEPAGEPVGDPPPEPGPVGPAPLDPLDVDPEAADDRGGDDARRPLPPPEPVRRSRVRPRGPTPLEVIGLSAGAGAAAAVAGAAGALVVGGATVATAISFERTQVPLEFRSLAVLSLLGGAIATPFAGALAASMAALFVTRPTAGPEEYAELAQMCLSCAMAAACAGLCLAGGFVGGPSVMMSQSCTRPFQPRGPGGGPRGETDNPVALAAGVGTALGAVVGAAAAWWSLSSWPDADTLVVGSALVGGAAGGAALGGLVVGGGAVFVERWRYVVFE